MDRAKFRVRAFRGERVMTSPAVIPATHFLCPRWRLYLFDYRACSPCAHRRGNLRPDSADWRTKRLVNCHYPRVA